MALMFQRLARNFIKNGYFPTDEDTTARILAAVAPSDRPMRILDPCCGEGVALAEAAHHLEAFGKGNLEAFGVEYNEERAYHAKTLLARCIHADLMDAVIQPRSFGLLWLNPPYGDLVADQAAASAAKWKGRKRLEKLFYERTIGTLQFGGVLVLIVPHYALDREFATWIARHCSSVQVFRASTDQFKQVVVFGVRKPVSDGMDLEARELLAAVGAGDREAPALPDAWDGPLYVVPPAPQGEPKFFTMRIDPRQLGEETRIAGPTLWDRFVTTFQSRAREHRRPLRSLSRWHLALALSAGQISGAVRSNDGRTLLVRGDTHKEKDVRIEHEVNERTGDVRETRIHLDRFVPVIRAIDFTPGSATFGDVLTIR
ncbi:DUF6094 domain-containing protein [Sulfurivermis fontis]|uniref:DUF6094 domain-containing protein n=1 Tax=Sulfurivermis fontis TaxID=1972068 RepID=UPI000FDBF811|nr:DUF6094 domain-containing protein [Sulfurivermis fontis]